MSLDGAGARSDGELMAQASAGGVDAFGELYDRYSDRAYRVARSVCHDDARAQDAVHDAFLSVWQNRSSYRTQRGTVPAWLLTVVRYRAIDLERHNLKHASRRAAPELLDGLPATDDVSEQAVDRADAERLRAALARLPNAQQEVITLAFYGQLSHTEIATHLGLPAGTVKGRMRLGMQKLRASIDQAVA